MFLKLEDGFINTDTISRILEMEKEWKIAFVDNCKLTLFKGSKDAVAFEGWIKPTPVDPIADLKPLSQDLPKQQPKHKKK